MIVNPYKHEPWLSFLCSFTVLDSSKFYFLFHFIFHHLLGALMIPSLPVAGLAYVSVRIIGHRASAVVMVLYYGTVSVPMCIVGSGLLHRIWNPFLLGPEYSHWMDYLILIAMGIAGYGGQWFTNLGLQHESAATATLATTSQIVWTYLFELAFLHEAINGWSIAGTGLIVGYMLFVAVLKIVSSASTVPIPSNGRNDNTGTTTSSTVSNEESEPLLH